MTFHKHQKALVWDMKIEKQAVHPGEVHEAVKFIRESLGCTTKYLRDKGVRQEVIDLIVKSKRVTRLVLKGDHDLIEVVRP
jgi:hypothetical protein